MHYLTNQAENQGQPPPHHRYNSTMLFSSPRTPGRRARPGKSFSGSYTAYDVRDALTQTELKPVIDEAARRASLSPEERRKENEERKVMGSPVKEEAAAGAAREVLAWHCSRTANHNPNPKVLMRYLAISTLEQLTVLGGQSIGRKGTLWLKCYEDATPDGDAERVILGVDYNTHGEGEDLEGCYNAAITLL